MDTPEANWKAEDLIMAARRKDVDKAREILKMKRSPEFLRAVDSVQFTAMTWAAQRKSVEIVRMLHQAGANFGLHAAAKMGDVGLAREILQEEKVREDINRPDDRGMSAMTLATKNRNVEIVRTLHEAGADFALHAAATMGDIDLTRELLQDERARECMNKPDDKGLSPIRLAVEERQFDIVRMLHQAGADFVLHAAARVGDVSLARQILKEESASEFINMPDSTGQTPIMVAAEKRNIEMVRFLHSAGADNGLNAAVVVWDEDLVREILQSEMVKDVINKPDCSGVTPIRNAAMRRRVEIIRMLHGAGADFSLHAAASIGDVDLVREILQEEKAREGINKLDETGNSAMRYAFANWRYAFPTVSYDFPKEVSADIVRILHQAGAEFGLNTAADIEDVDLVRDILKDERAREGINRPNEAGFSAMRYAALHGNVEIVSIMAAAGADYYKNQTELHIAAKFNNSRLFENHLKKTAKGKSQLECKDDYQMTPLRWAMTKSHNDIVEIIWKWSKEHGKKLDDDLVLWHLCDTANENLLECLSQYNDIVPKGASTTRAPDGTTALAVTVAKNNLSILSWLIRYGYVDAGQAMMESCYIGSSICFSPMLAEVPQKIVDEMKQALITAAIQSDFLDFFKQMPDVKFTKSDIEMIEKRYSKTLRTKAGLEMKHLDSELVSMSKVFPCFNKDVEQSWTSVEASKLKGGDKKSPFFNNVFEQGYIDSDIIEPFILGPFCLDLQSDCKHKGKQRQNDCNRIRDLLKVTSIIESFLNEHEIFGALEPKFQLIGSIKEETRVGMANEVDMLVAMKGLDNGGLTEDTYTLKAKGDTAQQIKPFACAKENDMLNFPKFLTLFLEAVKRCLEEKREEIQSHNLTYELDFDKNCKSCKAKTEESDSIYAPFMHCIQCLPAVTHTRVGACLIMKWHGEEVVTADLVPMFPVSETDIYAMLRGVLTRLREDRPPFWARHYAKAIQEDRAVGDEMMAWQEEEEKVSSHNKHHCVPAKYGANETKHPLTSFQSTLLSMKLLHYGPDRDRNSLIRPKQLVDVHLFEQHPWLRSIYSYIKVLKDLLGVDVSSYVAKKCVLSPKGLEMEEKRVTVMESTRQVLHEKELKRAFEDVIDYSDHSQDRIALTKKGQERLRRIFYS